MFGALDTATSGLIAQRIRMDTIAGNIANMHATQRLDGRPGPYQRRVALFASGDAERGRGAPGVHVSRIVEDPSPGPLIWDPNHPHAIQSGAQKGYVRMPNVELSTEMINAIEAARAYEANATVADAVKTVISSSLRLLA
ncbi:MAG: flagellar basal body rod protein FlgC [Phycisphaerales bacterium]|nr:MAG: flagellar basal body rod protein FlgC [Phycisphaerales bacterium]